MEAPRSLRQGEFVWASGDRYTGSWKEDLFSGAGKLTLSAGVSYDGSWQLGKVRATILSVV